MRELYQEYKWYLKKYSLKCIPCHAQGNFLEQTKEQKYSGLIKYS